MKYYLHDSNSFNDEKITELYINFGYEGLGLFYTLLEKLAQQEKPVKTSVLKAQLKVGKKLQKAWNFMEQIGLIYSNNGDTFNEQLLKFNEKYTIKKEKNAKRISQWRDKQVDTKNVTHYESVRNTSKDNISKVKISKENKEETLTCFSFDEFWNAYNKKTGRIACESKYKKIVESDRQLIKDNLSKYLSTVSEKKYQKDPLTYLNQKVWLDEYEKELDVFELLQNKRK